MIKVIKRNGQEVDFDANKIAIAIKKAMHSSTGIFEEGLAERIASEIETFATTIGKKMSIYDIEDHVYYSLIKYGNPATARAYENYKAVQTFKRLKNTTDESILGLLDKTNLDVINENSNKNAILASTQRDLIAGEVSKDIARRMLIPVDIVQAHDEGAIHLHDMDYLIQPMFNCCLVNIGDMLDNGTVINGKMVETPKSFQVACTVMTQIIAQVASGQFGGQSLNVAHLGKYLRKSYEKHLKLAKEILTDEEDVERIAKAMLRLDEIMGIDLINSDKYLNEIKEKEGVSKQSEFKFTLYKNDLILIKDTKNNEEQIFRFLSRTMPNQKNYVELKPYDKAKFDGNQELITIFGNVAKGGQCMKGLNKSDISIFKVITDVLGNKHFIKKEGEEPKLKF